VIVPFGQAFITALIFGLASGAAVWGGISAIRKEPAEALFFGYTFLVMFGCVLPIMWVMLLISHRRLLWATERLLDKDLDGDGHKGSPRQILGAQVKDTDGTTYFFDSEYLEITDQQLISMARAVRVHGRKWAESAWEHDKSIFPSLKEFRRVRGLLVKAGAIVKAPGKTGTFSTTKVGEVGFDRILEYAKEGQ
jgi:hypothetical protein